MAITSTCRQREFNAKYGPTAASESAVVNWAKSKGFTVSNRYSNRLVVDLTGTAAQVQSALGVHMNNYTLHGNTYFSNDRDVTLPDSLKSIVSSVEGLNNINSLQSATSSPKPAAVYSAGPVSQLHTDVARQRLAGRAQGRAGEDRQRTRTSPGAATTRPTCTARRPMT